MPKDTVVRMTTTAICGSGMHTYPSFLGVGDRVIIACIPDPGHLVAELEPLPGLYSLYDFSKDFGCLEGRQAEYVRISSFRAGDDMSTFGAGLLAAYLAILRGASKIYVIEHPRSQLDKAASIGAIPMGFNAYEKGVQPPKY
ncbi:hypothetical protein GGR53DRAFT_471361 [Hypoxylon sp. FL1150]|nr:hypothetical protein GGR53DRAFT_471361 [Hypoxylon sp. FL1150]